ncbi:tetratricopeptide repeat protein, partial [Dysgonomonas sp. OttesenSCG-928-M03]|nr:tetratricopeptide repeat protein [Dysgonomonas sp. OttesenSCG-928-M03]
MKKVLLTAGLCMLVTVSFAQKKAVKDAKSAMNSKNFTEARSLIKPALTNSETANDPDAWKTAGDIENKAYEEENLKQLTQKSFDEGAMYDALLNSYAPYLKADELGQIPDEKGKVKNKVRKDIASIMKANQAGFINGGVYSNNQQNFAKASEFFEKYWEIPSLPMFADDKNAFNTNDSTFQTIKYYAAICAIQAKDDQRAIKLLKKISEEPFTPNSTYKESDVYELLAAEYEQVNDSVNFIALLETSAEKFPKNKYFLPNLINQYIKKGQTDKALAYLDKAIANDPSSSCDMYSVKASLYAEKKEFEKADGIYNTALNADPNCERALEGLAVSYIVQAQNIKEEAGNVSAAKDRAILDDKAKELYTKAVPLLEKYKDILVA